MHNLINLIYLLTIIGTAVFIVSDGIKRNKQIKNEVEDG